MTPRICVALLMLSGKLIETRNEHEVAAIEANQTLVWSEVENTIGFNEILIEPKVRYAANRSNAISLHIHSKCKTQIRAASYPPSYHHRQMTKDKAHWMWSDLNFASETPLRNAQLAFMWHLKSKEMSSLIVFNLEFLPRRIVFNIHSARPQLFDGTYHTVWLYHVTSSNSHTFSCTTLRWADIWLSCVRTLDNFIWIRMLYCSKCKINLIRRTGSRREEGATLHLHTDDAKNTTNWNFEANNIWHLALGTKLWDNRFGGVEAGDFVLNINKSNGEFVALIPYHMRYVRPNINAKHATF